ncbi:dienelactone hydrolase family protein [Terrarubrum flagellatum]|uniref:dienelactone hydrolase family protein n=1 Tax=Terrirubrum flagellatum TaxID=2895980 RepID=UPI003145573B
MVKLFLAAASLALMLASSAQSQIVPRTELHAFLSATPTDRQFLIGAQDAPSVTLSAELRLPTAGADRLPVVVLLHASGGINAGVVAWANELNSAGVATLMIDSFTARKIVSTVEDQDSLSRFVMILDAYRALDLLAAHPRIDPSRIAVMGFSRGGGPAHWSAMERFRMMHAANSKARFALHIAFYPTCNRDLKDALNVVAPIRIIHGTADDYIPIKECRELVTRLQAAGKDATLLEVEGAHHVFDNPAGAPVRLAQAQTTRNCPLIREADDGALVNSVTNKAFSYASDPCVERGVTVGRNADGLSLARKAVQTALTEAGFVR